MAIAPEEDSLMICLGHTLLGRARLHSGEERKRIRTRAGQLFDGALRMRPSNPYAISGRAFSLMALARQAPGEETNQVLAEAAGQLDRSGWAGPEEHIVLEARGLLSWGQALCALNEEETSRLLGEAKQSFIEAEQHKPQFAAYNLACVYARLGEGDNCRRWLEASREPGLCVRVEQMREEPELQSVREREWFQELLAGPRLPPEAA